MRKTKNMLAIVLSVVMCMSYIPMNVEADNIYWDENINVLNEDGMDTGTAPETVQLDGCTVSFTGDTQIVELSETEKRTEGDKAIRVQKVTDTEAENYDSTYNSNILFDFSEYPYTDIVEITFSLWFDHRNNGMTIGHFNDENNQIIQFHRAANTSFMYNADVNKNDKLPNKAAKIWYDYRLLLNVKENTLQIEKDGTKITTADCTDGIFPFQNENTNPGLKGSLNSFRFATAVASDTNTHIYIDNISVRGYVEAPLILSETENVPAINQLQLKLDRDVCDGDITKETLALSTDDGTAPEIESVYKLSDSEWKIFLTDRLDYNTPYKLELPTVRDSSGKTADLTYEFTTEIRKPLGVYNLGFVQNGVPAYPLNPGTVSGLITIDNNTGEPVDAAAAAVLYKNVGEGFIMTDVMSVTENDIESSYEFDNLTLTVPDDGETYFVKSYLWDSLMNMGMLGYPEFDGEITEESKNASANYDTGVITVEGNTGIADKRLINIAILYPNAEMDQLTDDNFRENVFCVYEMYTEEDGSYIFDKTFLPTTNAESKYIGWYTVVVSVAGKTQTAEERCIKFYYADTTARENAIADVNDMTEDNAQTVLNSQKDIIGITLGEDYTLAMSVANKAMIYLRDLRYQNGGNGYTSLVEIKEDFETAKWIGNMKMAASVADSGLLQISEEKLVPIILQDYKENKETVWDTFLLVRKNKELVKVEDVQKAFNEAMALSMVNLSDSEGLADVLENYNNDVLHLDMGSKYQENSAEILKVLVRKKEYQSFQSIEEIREVFNEALENAGKFYVDWNYNINILNEDKLTTGILADEINMENCKVLFTGDIQVVELSETEKRTEGDKAIRLQKVTDTEAENYNATYNSNILFDFSEQPYTDMVEITFSLWFDHQNNGLTIGHFNDENNQIIQFHRAAYTSFMYNADVNKNDSLPNKIAKTWSDYRLLLNVKENTLQIEKDGTKITIANCPDGKFPFKNEGVNPGLNNSFESFRISTAIAADTNTHVYVDNMSVRGYTEKPMILSETENVVATREILLKLDRDVCDGDIGKGTLKLIAEGGSSPEIQSVYKVSDREWKIFLSDRLSYNTKYTLDLPTVYDSVGKSADLVYEFMTEERKPLGIYKLGFIQNKIPSYALRPGEVTGLMTVDNNTGKPIAATAAIILYKKSGKRFVMSDVKAVVKADIAENSTYDFQNLTVTVPDDGETYFAKLYLWDSLENMMPFESNAYKE